MDFFIWRSNHILSNSYKTTQIYFTNPQTYLIIWQYYNSIRLLGPDDNTVNLRKVGKYIKRRRRAVSKNTTVLVLYFYCWNTTTCFGLAWPSSGRTVANKGEKYTQSVVHGRYVNYKWDLVVIALRGVTWFLVFHVPPRKAITTRSRL
jgi:hypothetical protein